MQRNKSPNLVSLTTINPDGSHYILHPADVSGRFTFFRRLFGILLIAVYVLLPWIPINGAPALFLDVEHQPPFPRPPVRPPALSTAFTPKANS